jgi:preprotein translocase subunit SecG
MIIIIIVIVIIIIIIIIIITPWLQYASELDRPSEFSANFFGQGVAWSAQRILTAVSACSCSLK